MHMPQNGHWLASFDVITPPPPEKVSFSAAETMKISIRDAHPLLKRISDMKKIFFFFGCFCRKICHVDHSRSRVLDSRE